MKFDKELEEISKLLSGASWVHDHAVIGSAACTENPNDLDILVLTGGCGVPFSFLIDGWVCKTDETYGVDLNFVSLHKGVVNLIVTQNPAWFDRTISASNVCALLEIQSRPGRVAIYAIVRDGATVEEAKAGLRGNGG